MAETVRAVSASCAFWTVARHELLLLWRDRSLPIAVALLLALICGGLYNGLLRVDERDELLVALLREQDSRVDNLAAQLRTAEADKLDVYANPTNPSSLLASGAGLRYAIMPSAPLAPLTLGQSDLLPSYFRISGRSEVNFVYDSDIENPWHLSAGHFDAAYVAVYLLPLLILALSYNLLSAERERGTLRMLLAQPAPLAVVVLAKVAVRGLALLTPVAVLPLAVALLARSASDFWNVAASGLLWSTSACVYGLFWIAVAVMVNALGKSSAFNAIVLAGVWVAVVLVAPVTLSLAVEVIHPAPSRIEMVQKLHKLHEAAMRHYADLDRTDYETLRDPGPRNGKVYIQPTTLRYFHIQREVSEMMRPWMDDFEATLDRRQQFVETYRFLSPAATTFEAMSDLAGTNLGRHRHFQRLASDYYRQRLSYVFPMILSGTAVSEADLRDMPRFVWTEERSGHGIWRRATSLAELLLLTVALCVFSVWRLSNSTRSLGR
ncbi:ABC transporter permease subunit [Methylosinus sporium]|uniref:ABC transporter permease n=1 Tax=Methylosinus sporium TaxID=428 RepID=A0A2U1SS72_METSR|nr:ABC transporter permease subunit [Methylosinus sporium]PWB94433.1 ABC transporter permease [Methylosinus sporium]